MWDDKEYTKDTGYTKPTGELVIVPVLQEDNNYKYVLSYKFDIYTAEPFSRNMIYVDATTGEVVLSDAIIKHAEGRNHASSNTIQPQNQVQQIKQNQFLVAGNAATRYSGLQTIETTLSNGSYILKDTTRGGGITTKDNKNYAYTNLNNSVEFKDTDNNWTAQEHNNSKFDNAALDAHWGVAKTYDYFKNVFNRNSYNNSGAPLKSYVHVGNKWENAAWTGSEMVYGDGNTTFSPLTSLDVTAHELGHAVCSSTANLVYQRESGAINEGLSDIWGAAVEMYTAPNKQAFLIGEEIRKNPPYFLRSLSNPKSAGQPDTYRGTNWVAATSAEGCRTPSTTNDNCGVHTNSGVLNHWFYILTVGKSGTNDLGNSYNVNGIGIQKAEKIVYRLETAYLTSSSTYANAKDFGIQAAIDLYGANSAEHIATQNAFYAVGLGTQIVQSDVIAPSAPSSLAATNTTQTTTNLTWTASTDNIGVVGYDIYKNNTIIGSTTSSLFYNVTNLNANTTYNFFVKAKDSAGNVSASSNVVTVTTLAPIPDNIAPSTPTNLVATKIGQTSARLNWTASTDNVGVVGYNVYAGANLVGTSLTNSYDANNLTEDTSYTYQVKAKDATGNISDYSNLVTFKTLAVAPVNYCSASSSITTYERIKNVKVGTINNASTGTAGYEDFTNISTDLSKGSSYNITIDAYSLLSFLKGYESYAVFVDYNGDGDFDDANEKVLSKNGVFSTSVSGSFVVPTTAKNGLTRMRVVLKDGTSSPSACGSFTFGQVEDYTVNIVGNNLISKLINEDQASSAREIVSIYPNPAQDILNVKTNSTDDTQFQIVTASGQIIESGTLKDHKISVNKLVSGNYVLILSSQGSSTTHKFIKK